MGTLLEVTRLIRRTARDPSLVCGAMTPLLTIPAFQGSPPPPPPPSKPAASEGRRNQVQNSQDADKSPEGSAPLHRPQPFIRKFSCGLARVAPAAAKHWLLPPFASPTPGLEQLLLWGQRPSCEKLCPILSLQDRA